MRKAAMLVVSIMMMAVVAGCLGGSPSGTSTAGNSSANTSSSAGSRTYAPSELLKGMEGIHEFTYFENTSAKMTLDIWTDNKSQTENMTIIYKKAGYIDLKDREAAINTTTITFPGGASSFSRQIIKNNEVYISVNGRWIRLTNGTSGLNVSAMLNLTWNYNVVSFAKRYLTRKPSNVSYRNGTEFLYFPIKKEDLEAIARAFFGNGANVSMNVTNGVLELRFRNGTFVGGRMAYKMNVWMELAQLGGTIKIHEDGYVYDEFVVTDINVRKPVDLPVQYAT